MSLPHSFDDASGDELIVMISNSFPDLLIGHWRIDRSGGDHILVMIDERYAFRFPRTGIHDLQLEVNVLKRLRPRSAIPLPNYEYVDQQWRFAGYPLLAGTCLTSGRFAALAAAAQDLVLADIAHFLAELHALSPTSIAPLSRWRAMWTAEEAAASGREKCLPIIAKHAPKLLDAAQTFYVRYAALTASPTVVHGDLVAEHLLLDGSTGPLSGIIDFGDVALGDPAYDFMGLWTYGERTVQKATRIYQGQGGVAGLIGRSRDHFTRYQIDRLCERIAETGYVDEELKAVVGSLLNSTG